MSSLLDDDIEDQTQEEDSKEIYGVRDGTLFLIDTTRPMFEKDETEGISHFLKCIRVYKDILSQKLVWNRQDWMGLILFGTEKWDTDPEAKNILTVQKLSPVTKDNIQEIMEIDERRWKDYEKISSTSAYPLHDVLWHAAQAFSSVKVVMPKRRVILFTCEDDPPMTDMAEKHRIRVRATSYNDTGLQLYVVGLSENWNHNTFYKDLEMLSRKIDDEDYERKSLKDLVEQMKLPSMIMAKLSFHLGENVTLDVFLRCFSVKREYLKTATVSKVSNAPLTSHSYYRKIDANYQENMDEDDVRPSSPVLETEIQKYQEFGSKMIFFTDQEVKSLSSIREPGITLIGIKKIYYHPIYHFEAPYFVTCNESRRKDNKLLFGALLNKCDIRGLMIICTVTMRRQSPTNLYSMIPDAERGGFYLYKIPFKENVRDNNMCTMDYIYDDQNKPPTTPESIELMEKIIRKLRIEYSPDLFRNPKLQKQFQTIESLALDLEQSESPIDDTLPLNDIMRKNVGDLLDEYDAMFEVQEESEATMSKKKFKRADGTSVDSTALLNDETISVLVKQNKIESCTVVQLKSILKNHGLATSGTKDVLLKRIKEQYANK